MARNFVRTSASAGDRIATLFPALSDEITICISFRHATTPANNNFPNRHTLLTREASTGSQCNYGIVAGSSQIIPFWTSNTNTFHVLTATYTADTAWHTFAMSHKWGQTTQTRIYLDGANITPATKPTNATQTASMGSQHFGFRDIGGTNRQEPMHGDLANCAIYDKALSAGELIGLTKGIAPTNVGISNLVFFAPLVRDLVELTDAIALTNSGTTVANHPRVYA